MQLTRRDFLQDLAFVAAVVGMPNWMTQLDETPALDLISSAPNASPWQWMPPSDLGQGNSIITALNRIAFGPRPGDFERVQAMGIDAYIEQQLAPEKIDDSDLEQRLAQNFPTLKMSGGELLEKYPQPKPAANTGQNTPTLQTNTPQQVILELEQATLWRAVASKRQLQEVIVNFWSNHFSIFIGKNSCKWLKTGDDRDVIRKNALGTFGDILLASAQSPAMMIYLDNDLNVKGVPNENYAREIMELHSLGVNGGYTQKDVSELARALTGWGVSTPKRTVLGLNYDGAGLFEFNPKEHDDAAKTILGVNLPAGGGINDALKVIDVLAKHPSTARFIAQKLTRRFVSDTPPAALVERAAQTFTQTNGDIRAVLSVILHSDDFRNSFAQKIKQPFELIVSGLRAVDAQMDDMRGIATLVRAMGQGLFTHVTPDGYPDDGAEWINAGALLARWNLALLLGANRLPRGKVDLQTMLKNATNKTIGGVVDLYTDSILHRAMPDKDRQKIIDTFGKATANFDAARLPELVALILASPHFQYR